MEDYIVGVDSGGTSTVADAYDLDGNLLMNAKAGFGNLLMDQKVGLENIEYAVEEILSSLGYQNCKLIVFGIAGIDSGNFKHIIQDTFLKYKVKCIFLNDAWLAYYALLNGKDGCLIISGTGSIAIGQNQKNKKRVGGWGNILGDEGSGFDIAKRLVKDVLNSYDNNQSLTILEQKLLDELSLRSPFELVEFVYSSSKDQVAQISLFVSEEAANNNNQAINILKKAGKNLGEQAIKLLKKLAIKDNVKVAVTGNVLIKNNLVYETFKDTVSASFEECVFIRKDISNTLGAFYYFKNSQKKIDY